MIGIGIIVWNSTVNASIPKVGRYPASVIRSFEESRGTYLVVESIMSEVSKRSIDQLDQKNMKERSIEVFKEIFAEEYINFSSRRLGELDFSKVNYDFFVDQENGEFFIVGMTDDRLAIPINLIDDDKQVIGNVLVDPSFKILLEYDFES